MLREGLVKIPRTDIALINTLEKCPTCGAETLRKQYSVYATESGKLTGDGMNVLTDDEYFRCIEQAEKLVELAKVYPKMGIYLHKDK